MGHSYKTDPVQKLDLEGLLRFTRGHSGTSLKQIQVDQKIGPAFLQVHFWIHLNPYWTSSKRFLQPYPDRRGGGGGGGFWSPRQL